MNTTSEAPLVRADYNIPTRIANVRVLGGPRCALREYWVRCTGSDGSIFELLASEIQEILERFHFTGTPLERLCAAHDWALRSGEYGPCLLAKGEVRA